MAEKGFSSPLARRLFLARMGTGVGAVGAALAGAPAAAAQSAEETHWQPARHELDDWYEKLPGKHRFVFDTTSADGLGTGLQFASNFFEANKTSYGLQDNDLAVVIIVRHKSTAFGYNDAIWAKYSAELSKSTAFVDPKTKEAPLVNVYATAGVAGGQGGQGGQGGRMDTLIKRGVHVAICQMATRGIAGSLARATGGNADTIFSELAANLVGNAHLVPAGIVAVNRAQERGYTFVHAG